MKRQINLKSSEKIGLISSLATMLTAGIPILETVDSLLEDSKGNPKKILEALKSGLMQGRRISATFAEFPQIFDKVTVSIIKASEEAGNLETTLKDLRQNIQKEIEFNDKIKSALFYPLTVIVVFIGVLLVILIVVVPKISTVFLRLKVDLPLPTRILIFVSNTLLTYTIPVIVGIISTVALFIFIFKRSKKLLINILSSLPVVSQLVLEIDLTRLSRSLFLLLNSGIPITSALDLTKDVVVKREIKDMVVHTRELILSGEKLSIGLRRSKGKIPTIMIKMIEAGERSGSLDRAMQDVSEHFDYEVSKSLKTVTALLEPIMLVFVGVLVGGMMLAIIAPIYSLIGQVGSR